MLPKKSTEVQTSHSGHAADMRPLSTQSYSNQQLVVAVIVSGSVVTLGSLRGVFYALINGT